MITNEELLKKISELENRVTKLEEQSDETFEYNNTDKDDILLPEAIALSKPHSAISASFLQRRLSIGYARAARILDQLEEKGVIGPAEGSRPRKVIK